MFEKNEGLYFVKSEYDHFMFNYKLILHHFGNENRKKVKNEELLFGMLITSWATYYRNLYDFFNPRQPIIINEECKICVEKLKIQSDDLLIKEILKENDFFSFEDENKLLLNKFNNQLKDNVNKDLCQYTTHHKIKFKINKLISHLTKNRISTFDKKSYVWEVQICSEYISDAYNTLLHLIFSNNPIHESKILKEKEMKKPIEKMSDKISSSVKDKFSLHSGVSPDIVQILKSDKKDI